MKLSRMLSRSYSKKEKMVKSIFFSEGKYISLPFFAKRVTLNVSSPEIFNQSLKLYHPFSDKAKFVRYFFSEYLFSSRVLTTLLSKSYREGEFIKYLESKLGEKFHSSLYYPTLLDKLVIQLLHANGNIFGYVKRMAIIKSTMKKKELLR